MLIQRALLLQRLQLVLHLVRRDFRVRYSGSILGFVWSLAIPLSQLVILTFVFTSVLPSGIPKFPLFIFIGLLPWNWFSSSVGSAGTAFTESRDLLKHPGTDAAMLVVVGALAHLMTFVLSIPVLVGLMYWYGLSPPWFFPFVLLLLVCIQGILIVGLSLMIATANVFYRDVSHLVNLLIFLLFFMTPVWYAVPASSAYRAVFYANPMAHIIENYRLVLMEQAPLDWAGLGLASLVSVAFLFIGYGVYRRMKSDVVDAI